MALLFADGFDLYTDTAAVLAGGWNRLSTNFAFHATNGRFGGGCLTGDVDNVWETGVFVAVGDTVIVGWAYWHDGAGGATDTVAVGATSANVGLWALRHNTSGDLQALQQGGSQVGSTATAALPASTWNWIEVKVVLGTGAANGSIEVRVNGVSVITAATIDTNNGNPMTRMQFRGSAGNWRMDDVVIMDGSGSALNDFIGDTRIDTRIPNGAGSLSDWSGSSADVDDALGAVDDASSFISSSTPGDQSSFAVANLSAVPTTIHAVQVRARASKDDVGLRTLSALIDSGGTLATGPERGLTTTWMWHRNGFFTVDPDTTVAWDVTGIDAMHVGVEIVQ